MHELSVTESILEIASRHASQANATRVTDIHLVIGDLSSIVDDSVQFYWDMICQGTLCQGATLHFERIPARVQCQNCQNEFSLARQLAPCPNCGSMALQIISGEEFFVDSIEIEKDRSE
ncbi:MAG TPA: hydrogenase maturation nickel metallochaperone HypA [Anaerolineaceae bacterium]|nr:hydrogenase maturation nickel metallochaperone HypA [Anaerolineaceae bacterium]